MFIILVIGTSLCSTPAVLPHTSHAGTQWQDTGCYNVLKLRQQRHHEGKDTALMNIYRTVCHYIRNKLVMQITEANSVTCTFQEQFQLWENAHYRTEGKSWQKQLLWPANHPKLFICMCFHWNRSQKCKQHMNGCTAKSCTDKTQCACSHKSLKWNSTESMSLEYRREEWKDP